MCFNPTMVRLRLVVSVVVFVYIVSFQSHNGSIKTVKKIAAMRQEDEFQSHNGSIKTRADKRFRCS